jgi:ArsR family transcriptional regulator
LNPRPAAGATRRNGAPQPSTAAPLGVPESTIHKLTDVFGLLADRHRFKIVLALARQGRLHVGALGQLLGQSQPAVSHHLSLLRAGGLIDFDRAGKYSFYRLASAPVRDLFEQFFRESGNDTKQLHFGDFALTFKRK